MLDGVARHDGLFSSSMKAGLDHFSECHCFGHTRRGNNIEKEFPLHRKTFLLASGEKALYETQSKERVMSQQQGQGQPPQHQEQQPGRESEMQPGPATQRPEYRGSGKLQDKVAIITGGDSGIGHAVAVAFAKEGADVAIVYLNESEDAQSVK
jgi:short chain dehydrogenase